jgi:outer membrane protein assembly factor BamB
MRTAEETDGRDTGAATGGLLITGSQAGERTTVEALRLQDGVPVWWFDSRLRLSDLAGRNGVVVVSSHGRHRPGSLGPASIVGLRAEDGARLWHVGPAQLRRQLALRWLTWGLRALWMTSSPIQAWQAMQSLDLEGHISLSVAGEVALACTQRVIFAFNGRSGALLWLAPTLSRRSWPLLAAGGALVYIRGDSGALEALDAQTGIKRWSSEGRARIEFDENMLAVGETQVYLSSSRGSHDRSQVITALGVADGRREQALRLGTGDALAKVTAEGIAYVMREARLCAIRVADGAELWQSAPLQGIPDAEPETIAKSIRLAASEQILFYGYQVLIPPVQYMVVGALDASSGAHLWNWRGPERPLPLTGAPHLHAAQGNVYVITAAGIFVFTGADGRFVWHTPGDAAISRTMLSIDRFTPA